MLASALDVLARHWMLLAKAAGAIILLALIWDAYNERDAKRAVRKTAGRSFGLGAGIGSVVLAILVEGMHVVAEAPGLVMGAIGIGGMLTGIHWGAVAAVMLTAYIMMAAIRGV